MDELHEEEDHEEDHEEKRIITPNRITLGGKLLAIILITLAILLRLFTSLEFVMGDIVWASVALANIGLLIDGSHFVGNLGKAFGRH